MRILAHSMGCLHFLESHYKVAERRNTLIFWNLFHYMYPSFMHIWERIFLHKNGYSLHSPLRQAPSNLTHVQYLANVTFDKVLGLPGGTSTRRQR